MLRIERKRQIQPYIPTASMADIAFLLIIFFMVTTTFQVDKTDVKLPVTEIRSKVDQKAAFITLTTDGIIKFSDGESESHLVEELPYLAGEIQALTSINSWHQFVIKADRDVPYQRIDKVMQILRDSQAVKIYYLSDAEGGG